MTKSPLKSKLKSGRTRVRRLYAYEATPDSIQALAGSFTSETTFTIFSTRPFKGFHPLKLDPATLTDGKRVVYAHDHISKADVGVTDPSFGSEMFKPDSRARAILRGRDFARADLSESGGAYNLGEVQNLLGISRQAILKRVKEGSLLAVSGPSNRRVYPTCQFAADGTVLDGMREVINAFPSRNPWAVLNFLVNAQASLAGAKPIDLLRGGRDEQVIQAAHLIGNQGG